MKYYQELTLIDQSDVNRYHVYSYIYQELHRSLAHKKNGTDINIGISFPDYVFNAKSNKPFLGSKMRLFAKTKAELESINLRELLDTLADYVHVSSIKEVGDKATHYEVYTRYRHAGYLLKAERLQAHIIKKFGQERFDSEFANFEAVVAHCEKYNKQLGFPFINLKSASNGNPYCVRIKKEVVDKASVDTIFNGFGLSNKKYRSTVPAW